MLKISASGASYRRRGEAGRWPGVPHPAQVRPRVGPRLGGCGRPVAPLRLSSRLRVLLGEIFTLAFVPSNSENISLLAFLEPKTTENRQLTLWQLVNRLVPENM